MEGNADVRGKREKESEAVLLWQKTKQKKVEKPLFRWLVHVDIL